MRRDVALLKSPAVESMLTKLLVPVMECEAAAKFNLVTLHLIVYGLNYVLIVYV